MNPLILVANDDGIASPELDALTSALEGIAGVDVLVVAPERQRSAASHAITLHKPLRIEEKARNRYAVSGTPADCVYVGITRVATRLPTLVFSGINTGYNLGNDAFYSGTVAAALEGALRGSIGVAISLAPGSGPGLEHAVGLATQLATVLLEKPARPGTMLNVNVPHNMKGVAWTCGGQRNYRDDIALRTDPRGRPYYWIGGGEIVDEPLTGSDCQAVSLGYASVTPLRLDMTDHDAVRRGTPEWDIPGYAWKNPEGPSAG